MAGKRLNLSKHSEITHLNGVYLAKFQLFELEGRGDTERDAMSALAQAISQRIESDVRAAEEFNVFVDKHGEEVDAGAGLGPEVREAMKAVRGVDAAEFDRLLSGNAPLLVDFWADWCKPCHMIAPAVRDLKKELEGRVDVVKLNIDEQRSVADRYDVKSIPTLILFRDGQEQVRLIGARLKSELDEELKEFL